MKRGEAAEKVVKLRRLADGTSNIHEATAARAQATKLIIEHRLTERDLASGEKATAFDDLIDRLHQFAANLPKVAKYSKLENPMILNDVLKRIKTMDKIDKSKRLDQLTPVIRGLTFIAGDHIPYLREIRLLWEDVLHRHNIKI
jgi:hypothetical protein